MKYVKKPIVIDAVQLNSHDDLDKVVLIAGGMFSCLLATDGIFINTLEGEMKASFGDWIIKGIKGEFYPCKDDIFKATYDAVED